MLLSQLELPYERVPVDIFAGDSQTDASGLPAAGHLVDRTTWDLRAEPSQAESLLASVPSGRALRIPCGPNVTVDPPAGLRSGE